MSLEAILAEIEATVEAQIIELRQQSEAETQAIQAEAERTAAARYETARLAVVGPMAVAKAQHLYEAQLAAEQATAVARATLLQKVQTEAQYHLSRLRHDPDYGFILRGLIGEALQALGTGEEAQLIIDARDQAMVADILYEMELDLPVEPTLNCWGGVVVQSGDGRITVNNTLESRLERAMAYVEL